MCTFTECLDKVVAKGLCTGHYKQMLRGSELTPKRARRPQGSPPKPRTPLEGPRERNRRKPILREIVLCVIGYCDRDSAAKGLCKSHYQISRRFGFSAEQLVEFYADGSCNVCGTTQDLHIDHDHGCCSGNRSCGACVRGLLCRACNLALGYLKEDPERVSQMLKYVNTHHAII